MYVDTGNDFFKLLAFDSLDGPELLASITAVNFRFNSMSFSRSLKSC